jgi:hypothetical protein
MAKVLNVTVMSSINARWFVEFFLASKIEGLNVLHKEPSFRKYAYQF